MARIPIDETSGDARFELPDEPTRWDWGMFLANALGTVSNCLSEASDFFDACAGMLGGDFAARRREAEVQAQNRARLEIESLRHEMDESL